MTLPVSTMNQRREDPRQKKKPPSVMKEKSEQEKKNSLRKDSRISKKSWGAKEEIASANLLKQALCDKVGDHFVSHGVRVAIVGADFVARPIGRKVRENGRDG